MLKKFRKKSQIIDLIYYMSVLFMIAVVGLLAYYVLGQYEEQVTDDNLLRSENIQMVTNYNERLPNMVDHLFIFALIGIGLVTLVSALFVVSHPLFYGLMIIIMAFITWIAAIYANVFQELASHPEWSTYADKFVLISHVMRYYPLTIIVISIVIVVVMVAKK